MDANDRRTNACRRREWSWLAVAVVVMLSLSAGQTSQLLAQADGSKEFRKTVPLKSGGRLEIEAYKGSVNLQGWDRDEVEIIATIEAPTGVDRRYAEETVEATEIEVRARDGYVSIRSDYDKVPSERRWFFGSNRTLPYVHYQIKAPRQVELRLEDHKSDLEVASMRGQLTIDTYKGALRTDNISGRLILETYKGEARVRGFDGSLDVSTYKGDVIIEASALAANSRLETYKGRIEVKMPAAQGFELVADLGRRVDFHSDFEVPRQRQDDDDRYIKASVNGGGPELYLRSTKGSIRLRN